MINKLNVICDYDGCFHKLIPFLEAVNIPPVILTGRPPSEEVKTLEELKEVRFSKLFVYPKDYNSNSFTGEMKNDIAKWKAEMVKILKTNSKITIFIDDDLTYWIKVRELNPDVICLLI